MALLTDSPPESALMMTFELTRNTNNRGISESKVHPVYTCTYGAQGLVLQADTIGGRGGPVHSKYVWLARLYKEGEHGNEATTRMQMP